jgi:hypothetical protein
MIFKPIHCFKMLLMQIMKKNRNKFNDNQIQKPERLIPKALIYQNILEQISKYTLEYPDIETGGELYGFWTHSGCPVVQVVTGPGPAAQRTLVSFHQDVQYLKVIHNDLYHKHGLQHLGAWHSHHRLALAVPSGYDVDTVKKGLESTGLKRIFIVITNIRDYGTDINGFLFSKEFQDTYVTTPWKVLGGDNLFENISHLILAPRELSNNNE